MNSKAAGYNPLLDQEELQSGEPLVEVRDLVKNYTLDGKVIEVLSGIDLTLVAGEKVSIVGKSGVGKSTLMHVLGTLDRPTSGKVLYRNLDVFSQKESQLARFRNKGIGFVFQFHYLLPDFSALENVMVPMRIAREYLGQAEERAAEMLRQVGLDDRLHHKPGELSGGEQQRVAIARALVMQPRLVLADEPTGNLDDQTSEGIHDLFQELNDRYRTTVVVVTHDHKLAGRMDRRLLLKDGRLQDALTSEPTV
jgi:lipoprotein-releasing system ATP-binding protein